MRAPALPQKKSLATTAIIKGFRIYLFISLIFLNTSCAQTREKGKILFAGSTPCDSLIKNMAGIPLNKNCEFMKWEVHMWNTDTTVSQLTIELTYGMTRPNTNGFSDGWEKLNLTGYLEKITMKEKRTGNLYIVKTENNRPVFYLMKLGENLFHFTDSAGKPLTGNGGWGYVLNRIPQNTASK